MVKGKTACGVFCLAAAARCFVLDMLNVLVIFGGHDVAKAVVKREP
jgi:hypothetical protein